MRRQGPSRALLNRIAADRYRPGVKRTEVKHYEYPPGLDTHWNFAEDFWEYRIDGDLVDAGKAFRFAARSWFARAA